MSTGFDRLAALFAELRTQRPGPRRDRALEDACGEDESLRERLLSLLDQHDRAEDGESEALALDAGLDACEVLRLVEPVDEPPPDVPGYRVVGRVGAGGMGVVWEAEQERPRRRVALKILRPELATVEGVRRFEREADLLARLRHPGVAQVFEQGVTKTAAGERPYLTMEFVEGLPLTDFARENALDLGQRVECLARVCEAVGHLHAHGVIHRDLKPGNILVTPEGEPKVLDFGVAKPLESGETLRTRAGAVVGTLAYMSPEQAAGTEGAADSRSDVYALGLLAYEMLAGRPAYELEGRNLPSALRTIQEVEPLSLGRIDRRLRGDVAAIVAKALDKDAAGRYASAAEMAADLRRHLADEPIVASRVAPVHQARKFVRRHKTFVAAAATFLLALVGGLVASLHYMDVAKEEAAVARSASRLARLQAAAAALDNHESTVLREHLDEIPASQRGWAWRYLDAQVDRSVAHEALPFEPRTIDLTPSGVVLAASEAQAAYRDGPAGAWSPPVAMPHSSETHALIAGARRLVWTKGGAFDVLDLATGRVLEHFEETLCRISAASGDRRHVALLLWQPGGHAVEVRDTATFEPEWRVPTDRAYALALSADGGRLAVAYESQAAVYDVGHAEPIAELPIQLRSEHLAFSPDARRLATAAPDQTVWIADIPSRERVLEVGGLGSDPTALCFLDDERFALAHTAGPVEIRDARSGERLRLLQGHVSGVQRIATDGSTLWTAAPDGVREWALEGAPPDVLRVHGEPSRTRYPPFVYLARVTPDGGRLVSGGWDGFLRVTDLATGRPLARYPTSIVKYSAPAANGRFACGGDHELVAFDPSTGETLPPVPRNGRSCVAADRDGRRLLFGGRDGSVTLVDQASGAVRFEVVPGDGAPIQAVAFGADDRRLAAVDEHGGAFLLDAVDGRRVHALVAPSHPLLAVAFDRAGRRLAAGGADGTAYLWDVASGARLLELPGQGERVYAVAFSANGRELATGSSDGIVRIYETATGALLLRLRGHHDYVKDAAFSADGATLVSASGDGTIRVWSTVRMADRRREARALLDAEREMAPWVESRRKAGEEPAAILAAADADPKLDAIRRRAVANLLVEGHAR